MRWLRRARHVDRPPIEIEPIELYASRVGPFAGLCWVGLGVSIFAGLIIAGVAATRIPTGGLAGRVAMIGGVVLAAPGIVFLSWVMLVAGRRLLRSRQGSIAFTDHSLVINDRWMLNEPLIIERRDIRDIVALERLGFFQYSAFAGDTGFGLGASGVLLDWGTRPNFRIDLHQDRQFLEAIRTVPSRSTLQPISKYTTDRGILIRVTDQVAASIKFNQWMQHTASGRRPRPAARRQVDPARFGLLVAIAFLGFVCFCVGPAL